MQLAKVIGTVVTTQKDATLTGYKILMIQPVTDELKSVGVPIAAIDAAQAGVGDLVHWVAAREASLVMDNSFSPVDAAITGIVDHVNPETNAIKNKKDVFEDQG